MPLFICPKCGCIENTATSSYWSFKINASKLQYHPDLEKYRGKPLCSECGTIKYRKDDNGNTISVVEPGEWHGKFPKELANDDYKRRVKADGLIY